MTNTEQKEQDSFEGVRAEFHAESVDHPICLILNAGDENEVSIECESVTVKREKLLTIVEQFANRWNNQATLKSEMNELADKIVEMEKSSNNSLDKLGDSNGKLLLACSNLSDKDAEITRLKEEALDEARKLFEAHEENSRLGPENERLEAKLEEALERVKELETPDTCFANNDPHYGVDIKQSSNFANILKYEGCYDRELLQIWTAKFLKLHYCFFEKDRTEVRVFDTLEAAQAALKERDSHE